MPQFLNWTEAVESVAGSIRCSLSHSEHGRATCMLAYTHSQIKAAPTDHSPVVQTGLIRSHPPPPHTTARALTTQWVDAQPQGFVCKHSEWETNNASGLISQSTSQLPGLDISSQCYCFAWVLLSCPFLSTTARRERLAQSTGWGLFGQQGTPMAHGDKHQAWLVKRGKGEFDRKIMWPIQVPRVFYSLCVTNKYI